MNTGPIASFDLFAQLAVYAFWGGLFLFYLLSAIGQTLKDRPNGRFGRDLLQWVTLLAVQLGLTGALIYLTVGIGTNQIGL